MHVHVAAGDQRQLEAPADFPQCIESLFVASVGKQFDRDPQAVPECLSYPVVVHVERERVIRHPQHDAVREPVLEEAARQHIAALLRRTPGARNQPAECRITVAVLRERHQLAAAVQSQLGADDEFDPEGLRRHVRTHDTGHRTLVGNRERLVAERRGRLDEFLGMRRAAQEREIAERVQFRIASPPHDVIRTCRADTSPPRHRTDRSGRGRPKARRRKD